MIDIDNRIREAENEFNQLEEQRQQIIARQQELRGIYKTLTEVKTEQSEPNKQATVIEAVAEEDK